MNYKAVQNGDNVHASVNGVVSSAFARPCKGGGWAVLEPRIVYTAETLGEALRMIAGGLGDWYTVQEAAAQLAETGAFDEPPSAQMMCRWCKAGQFPGAVKVPTQGRGGSWRIPAAALAVFAEGRKER